MPEQTLGALVQPSWHTELPITPVSAAQTTTDTSPGHCCDPTCILLQNLLAPEGCFKMQRGPQVWKDPQLPILLGPFCPRPASAATGPHGYWAPWFWSVPLAGAETRFCLQFPGCPVTGPSSSFSLSSDVTCSERVPSFPQAGKIYFIHTC